MDIICNPKEEGLYRERDIDCQEALEKSFRDISRIASENMRDTAGEPFHRPLLPLSNARLRPDGVSRKRKLPLATWLRTCWTSMAADNVRRLLRSSDFRYAMWRQVWIVVLGSDCRVIPHKLVRPLIGRLEGNRTAGQPNRRHVVALSG